MKLVQGIKCQKCGKEFQHVLDENFRVELDTNAVQEFEKVKINATCPHCGSANVMTVRVPRK